MIQSAIGAIISPSKAESRPVPLGSVPLNYYTQGKSSQRSGEKAAKSSGSGGTSFGPFKLGKTIGQGEFGKVKLGFHIENGNQVQFALGACVKLIFLLRSQLNLLKSFLWILLQDVKNWFEKLKFFKFVFAGFFNCVSF